MDGLLHGDGKTMTITRKRLCFFLLCVVVPPIMLVVVSALCGIFPFGTKSFLTEDLAYQYHDFFLWLRRVLHGEGSLLYTTSLSLGVNAWGIYSYYLGSPLNLFVAFVDVSQVTMFVYVITALKLSLIQCTSVWFLRRRFSLSYASAFALALCLTWCQWVGANLRNPLWLDVIYLLPLAMGACWRLVKDGRVTFLSVCVAAAVISCWYMGYMLILFLMLYVLLEAWLLHVEKPDLSIRFFARRALYFGAALGLGILLSAWTFIPTVLNMLGGSSSGDLPAEATHILSEQLLGSFFVGTYARDITPQIFAGTLPLLLTVMLFFDGRVSPKVRIAAFALLFFLVLSTNEYALEYIWCGFRPPNGFYCRMAYFVAAMLIWAAGYECTLLESKGINLRSCIVSAATLALLIAFTFWQGFFVSVKVTLATAGFLVLIIATLWYIDHDMRCSQKPQLVVYTRSRIAKTTLIAICACELVWGGYVTLRQLYTWYMQDHHDAYVFDANHQLAELREQNDGFWRADRLVVRAGLAALNESLAEAYPSLSSYCSVQNGDAISVLCALGYSNPGDFSVRYASPILASDAFLGLRYVFSTGGSPEFVDTGISPTREGVRVYENKLALPLGYATSDHVTGDPIALENSNPALAQNQLASALVGRGVSLFSRIEPETCNEDSHGKSWEFEVPDGTIGYYYVAGSPAKGEAWIRVDDGVPFRDAWRFQHAMTVVGLPREHHRVWLGADADGVAPGHGDEIECQFYALDLEELKSVLNELRKHPLILNEFGGARIAGTINPGENDTLLLTVPWDKGWTVRVNGSVVEASRALSGAAMSIPVSAGDNVIELSYLPAGLLPGCLITGVTVVALCVVLTIRRRSSHKTEDPKAMK